MNFKKILLVSSMMFAGFIQVGCGNNQAQNCDNGMYATGQQPNQPYNQQYNNQNVQQPCNAQMIQPVVGQQQQYNQYGQPITTTPTSTGLVQGTCRVGFLQTPYGCFERGPCNAGDAYISSYGQCYHQN